MNNSVGFIGLGIMGQGMAKVSAMRHAFDLACRMGLQRRRESTE